VCVLACAGKCKRVRVGAGVTFARVALPIYNVTQCVVLSLVASLARLCFSTLSLKEQDSRKKNLFNLKCFFLFSLQLLSKTFVFLRRMKRDVINVKTSSYKVPVILARFLTKLEFSGQIFEKKI
jgi:hypothetical protein